MTDPIRILIADDHAIVREGLRGLIATEEGMQLVGEASNGDEAVSLAMTTNPDVVLLDLVMPHMDGLQALNAIKLALPKTRFLVLTSFSDDARVFAAIRGGALGYLLKDSSPQELFTAIREVYRGEPYLHPTIARKLMHMTDRRADHPLPQDALTPRELEVLHLMASGMPNRDIADRLVINERTVRTHVSSILAKLGLENRTQAVLFALRQGLVLLDDKQNDQTN
jgi:NarL family two-component system response regulator LiaR